MSTKYIPNTKEEYMNPSQLQYFATKLNSMKQEYESISMIRLQELHSTKSDLNDETYNGSYMEVDLLNEDNHAYIKKEIDEALQRIEDMSYGYCEDTGAEIGIKRLSANPVARYCIRAQENHESQQGMLSRLENRYGDEA